MHLATGDKFMSDFNPNVIEMFMFKWQADFYAWKARQKGFTTTINGPYDNWLELGGRWSVTLVDETKKVLQDLVVNLNEKAKEKEQDVDEFSRPIIKFKP